MKKITKAMTLILVVLFILSGCATGKKTSDSDSEGGKITFSVAFTGANNETWKNDDYYKYISEKLNFDVDFISMSNASYADQARIWISSNDMPDVVCTNFVYSEYLKYAENGNVRPLPKDYKDKHRGVDFAIQMTAAEKKLQIGEEKEVYGVLRPYDRYTRSIQAFRDAFNNGEDVVELMNKQEYKGIDGYGFAYRKDWAEKLGIKASTIMEYDDFINMVKAFKEADLGNVGKNNTVGIVVDYTEAPNIFVTAFNSSYKYFHKKGNKYVCGYLEPETVEGVKAYSEAYRSGILSPDFFTLKSQDLNSIFCTQRSGIIFPRADVGGYRALKSDFKKANPDLVPEDCIDLCWIKSPDGKVHGWQSANYGGIIYFNPELSDEKMNKILSIMDYIISPDGGAQVELGVPDVDYKEENGEYIILRDKNENGELPALSEKYPSYKFFSTFVKTLFDVYTNPDDKQAETITRNLVLEKKKHDLSLLELDLDRNFYSDELYTKFQAANDINSILAEVITADGDVEENWEKKIKSIRADAEKVAEKMTKDLMK